VAALSRRAPLASVPVLGRRGAIALTCAAALVMPAAAHANAFDEVFREYQNTGKVDGCRHTATELEQAEAQLPKGIEQSAPAFPQVLAAAAAQRAKGDCAKEAAQSTTTATAATPPASATTEPPATSQPAAPAASQPAPAATTPPAAPAAGAAPAAAAAADDSVPVVLVVAGALVALILVLWGMARWWAWEPRWLVRWRHATAEAGWRASAAWAEFTDWLRLGR
jgi:hypothetical protein